MIAVTSTMPPESTTTRKEITLAKYRVGKSLQKMERRLDKGMGLKELNYELTVLSSGLKQISLSDDEVDGVFEPMKKIAYSLKLVSEVDNKDIGVS